MPSQQCQSTEGNITYPCNIGKHDSPKCSKRMYYLFVLSVLSSFFKLCEYYLWSETFDYGKITAESAIYPFLVFLFYTF